MFSLLPFAAFVKRFSAKNETDARKRGFHPPARRVFPQKSSDNALSDLSRLFFQALDTGKSDLSLSSAKKRKSKTSVGSIFRCAPRPPDFSDGKRRRLQNRFPFRRKREEGQGQERGERFLFRARVQPPRNLRVHRPIQSLLMRLFQTRRVFIEYRHFVLPPGLFAPAFEAVFPSAFPFALFYDDSIAYIT